jgi:molybdopterin-guanine dinucleotide biosynthesis protein A
VSDRAAIVLAGGRASRMGGEPKPLLTAGGRTLLARVADAAIAAGCDPIIVVGPEDAALPGATLVREDPPFGGPAAGIVAALPLVDAAWTLVLAADLAHPDDALAALLAATAGPDGVVLTDPDGREQWLAAAYRTSALRERAVTAADWHDASVRRLAGSLDLTLVPAPAAAVEDIDTWEDFERIAREEHPNG